HDYQTHIQPQVDVLDVEQVAGQFAADAFQVGVGRQLHLCQSGQAGAHLQTVDIAWNGLFETRHELRTFWTRPDQAHLAAQHVPELRQLVEMRLAQKTTYTG